MDRRRLSVSFYVLLILVSGGSVLLIVAGAAFAVGSLNFDPSDPAAPIVVAVFGGMWLFVTLYMWLWFRRSGVLFDSTSFVFRNWRGKTHQVRYADVVGMSWRVSLRTPGKRQIRVEYLSCGRRGWLDLRSDYGWAVSFAEKVCDELARRCDLHQSPVSNALSKEDSDWTRLLGDDRPGLGADDV